MKSNKKTSIVLEVNFKSKHFKDWLHVVLDEYIPHSSYRILKFGKIYLTA